MAFSKRFPVMSSSNSALRRISNGAAALFFAGALISASPLLSANKADGDSAPSTTKAAVTKGKLGKKADSFGISQVDVINDQIRQGWLAHGYTPSGAATDGEFCRRLYLDVLGRIPSVDELTKYLNDHGPDKKLRLVDRLLSDEYVEEYARNWTTLWTNVLIGRAGGTEENSLTNREGLQQSLRRALQRNMPYDKMVFELVAAKGSNRPGEKNFNGFVNFLANKLDENGVQATAKTAQIFLGMQVQCTQCHNHPFNDAKQNQFWQMNAFFRQTRALRRFEGGRDVASVELTNQDFAGEGNSPKEAASFYELRNGKMEVAYPTFVDGTEIEKSGYLDEVDRRTELAKLIVKSDEMPKAIVNRLWSHFLGYGFTKPVDDMGPHNPPTHPELLDSVGAEFRKQYFDVKGLIRWIALSEAYGLSSKFGPKNLKDDPSLGEKPMFSHFYLRQMRAEELYESLLVATEAHKTKGTYEEQEKLKRDWLGQFVIAFGTDENDETTTFNGTIPQALMMMNGDMIKKATSIESGSFLFRLAGDAKMSNAAKINYLYMAALARKPASGEVAMANEVVALRKGNALAALQDVWWTLLNSNEFIINH
jgi:hypothetical protein